MDLVSLLVALLVAAVVYWLAGLLGLPHPIPAVVAVIVLILFLVGRVSLPL